MRQTLLLTTALSAVLLLGGARSEVCSGQQADQGRDIVLAQASGTNLGTPQTQPRPGGGVDAGPGAPTPAAPGALGDRAEGRGAPPPGSATPTPSGDATTGSNVAPSGAIRPGSQPEAGGTGGGQSGKGP